MKYRNSLASTDRTRIGTFVYPFSLMLYTCLGRAEVLTRSLCVLAMSHVCVIEESCHLDLQALVEKKPIIFINQHACILYLGLLLFFFYWSIIAIQWCVRVCSFLSLTEGRNCLANLVNGFSLSGIYLNLIFLHTCFLPFLLF